MTTKWDRDYETENYKIIDYCREFETLNHCCSAFKKELDVFIYDKNRFELTFNSCNTETIEFMSVSLQSLSFFKW